MARSRGDGREAEGGQKKGCGIRSRKSQSWVPPVADAEDGREPGLRLTLTIPPADASDRDAVKKNGTPVLRY